MKASDRQCSIEGCTRQGHARTWCITHYQRWRTGGSVHLKPRIKMPCSLPDCDGGVYSNGLCRKHYVRKRYKGSTDLDVVPTLAERLAAAVEQQADGCWIWKWRPGKNGYGRISINNKSHYAHRASYEFHVGPIPDGLTLDHLCRVRTCVNPAHLEPVTRAENTRRELAAIAKESA